MNSYISPPNQFFTASFRTAFPCTLLAWDESVGTDGRGSADMGSAGRAAGRAVAAAGAPMVGSPASRIPPDSHSRPRPAIPQPPPPGGRGFRSSPGGRRIHRASAPFHSATRRTRARAHSCHGVRHRTPSGDTAACFHKPYSQRLSIVAPSLSARRYYYPWAHIITMPLESVAFRLNSTAGFVIISW